jgi:hypothetical protein
MFAQRIQKSDTRLNIESLLLAIYRKFHGYLSWRILASFLAYACLIQQGGSSDGCTGCGQCLPQKTASGSFPPAFFIVWHDFSFLSNNAEIWKIFEYKASCA